MDPLRCRKGALSRYEKGIGGPAREPKICGFSSPGAHVRKLLWMPLIFVALPLAAQTIEFDHRLKPMRKPSGDMNEQSQSPDSEDPTGFFKSAGVEMMTTAMQASAQVLKVEIGEGRLVVPLFFQVGAAGSAFKSTAGRAALAGILNPLGGNFNLRSAGARTLWKAGEKTVFRVNYNIGAKQLTSADTTGTGVPLVLGTAEGGFRFETRATLDQNLGVAYIEGVAGGIQGSDISSLRKLFGANVKQRFATMAVDAGVAITDLLLAKVSLYQVIGSARAKEMRPPVFKFGFDYTPKK